MPVQPKKPVAVKPPLAPLKPGQMQKLATPDIPLSPTAQALVPDAETQARAKELRAKIKAYEAEILRLRAARQKVDQDLADASSQHKKLEGIDPKLLKYFSYIEKNCGEFLTAARAANKLLFRGQSDSEHPVFVGYPRENRRPKDSSAEAQQLFDQYLSALGFKALRSNSIFTSSDDIQAGNYGTVYAIFPKDGFSFTWSTKETDLVMHSISYVDPKAISPSDVYEDLGEWVEKLDIDVEHFIKYDSYEPGDDAALVKKIKQSPAYKKLSKGVSKWNNDLDPYDGEATVTDVYKQFLAIVNAYREACVALPVLEKVLGKKYATSLKKDIDKSELALTGNEEDVASRAAAFVKKRGFIHENLPAALKSEHEICVLGEYVAVNWEDYEEELIRYFLPPKKKPAAKKMKLFPGD